MRAINRVEEAHVACTRVGGHGKVASQAHGRLEADVGVAGGDVTRQFVAARTVLREGTPRGDIACGRRGERTRVGDGGDATHIGCGIHRQIVARKNQVSTQVHRATQGGAAGAGLLGEAGCSHSGQRHILCRHHVDSAQRRRATHSPCHHQVAATGRDGQVACRCIAVDG